MKLLRRERLANNLILEFHDLSNRYFGDYHRLHIEVRCRIPLNESLFPTPGLPDVTLEQARQALGSHVEYRHELTRMGVAGADVKETLGRMMDDFMTATGHYLASEGFPAQFVGKQFAEARKKRRFTPRIV